MDHLKDPFLDLRRDAELPQRKRLLMDSDPLALVENAAAAIGLNLSKVQNTRRISNPDKEKRDMLIY